MVLKGVILDSFYLERVWSSSKGSSSTNSSLGVYDGLQRTGFCQFNYGKYDDHERMVFFFH